MSVEGDGQPEGTAAPAAEIAALDYNPVFHRLVDDADHLVIGLVAYGLYKIAKREWVVNHTDTFGLSPSPNEYTAFANSQTPTTLQGYRSQAKQVVDTFAAEVVKEERPKILKDALKGNFLMSVAQNLVASLIFSAILAAIVIIAAIAGVGLPIQFSFGTPHAPAPASSSSSEPTALIQ